jgi:hypothetical protein
MGPRQGGVKQLWCDPSHGPLGAAAAYVCDGRRGLIESGSQAKVDQPGIVMKINQYVDLAANTANKDTRTSYCNRPTHRFDVSVNDAQRVHENEAMNYSQYLQAKYFSEALSLTYCSALT